MSADHSAEHDAGVPHQAYQASDPAGYHQDPYYDQSIPGHAEPAHGGYGGYQTSSPTNPVMGEDTGHSGYDDSSLPPPPDPQYTGVADTNSRLYPKPESRLVIGLGPDTRIPDVPVGPPGNRSLDSIPPPPSGNFQLPKGSLPFPPSAFLIPAPTPASGNRASPSARRRACAPPSELPPQVGMEAPVPTSDPTYNQLGLSHLEKRSDETDLAAPMTPPPITTGSGADASPYGSDAASFKPPTVADLPRLQGSSPLPISTPDYSQPATSAPLPTSPYVGQRFGESAGAAVDADGRPRYVPELPEEAEDPAAYGRRVAGVTWSLYGVLLALTVGLMTKNVSVGGSFGTPILLVGLAMLTGARWSGILGVVATLVYTVSLSIAGYFITNPNPAFFQSFHLTSPPPEHYAYAFFLLALSCLFSNLLMLVGSPGVTRAILGAFLMILPQIGATALIAAGESRPMLTSSIGGKEPAIVRDDKQGFSFVKPAGWSTYSWAEASRIAPVVRGLTTEPSSFFLNEKQDLLFAVYLDEVPKRSLAQLFGPEKLTPLEREITRDLPSVKDAPEPFDFAGKPFLENSYEGTASNGAKLYIILNKVQVGDRMLLITMTRDAAHNDDPASADSALDDYYRSLKFEGPAASAETTTTK
jgi:hypothetical protein